MSLRSEKDGARASSNTATDDDRRSNIFDISQLPLEIRLLILRHALVRSTPLRNNYERFPDKSTTDPDFDGDDAKTAYKNTMALLATCRQIHNEGILHFWGQNRFELSLIPRTRQGFYIPQRRIVLSLNSTENPSFIRLIQNLDIAVYNQSNPSFPIGCCILETTDAVHRVCGVISTLFNLSQMSISVKLCLLPVERKYFHDLRPIVYAEILRPFAYLRGVRQASVRGVEGEQIKDIEEQMIKQQNIANIWKIKDAVDKWFDLMPDLKLNEEHLLMQDAWKYFYIAT